MPKRNGPTRTHTRITTDTDRVLKRLAKRHGLTNAEILDRLVSDFDSLPARDQREVLTMKNE